MTRADGAVVIRGARWPGDILVVDGRVAAVGDVGDLAGIPVLDASGGLVTAGLVNTHHHLFQRVTRGRAVGCDLLGWLRHLLPVWSRLTPEDMATAARLALCELALAGVSTTVDHHFVVPGGNDGVMHAIADAAGTVGLRLVLARGVIDLGPDRGGFVPDSLTEDPEAAMASVEALADSMGGLRAGGPDVTVAVAPSSLFAVSRELLRAAAELARRKGLRLHLHLSESAAEEGYCLERFGRRPVELLDELGWLDQPLWVAHAIHLRPQDRERLGGAGVGVAHCPGSNARLASGICPVSRLQEAGCAVGLGCDGAAANDAGGLLGQARLALQLARLSEGRAGAMLPAGALALATTGGAACLGRPELGRLEVGAPADLAVWPGADIEDFPDPVDGLVLGPDRLVLHLLVGGRPVVVDGRLPGVDLEALRRDVTVRSQRIGA